MRSVRRAGSFTASVVLAAALAALAPSLFAQTQIDSSPLLISGDGGSVAVSCAMAGSDLDLKVTFPADVKTYLSPARPAMSLAVDVDTDNNPRTGLQTEDARRGTDYAIDFIVRLSGDAVTASADDLTVVQHTAESTFGTLVPAKTAIRVDAGTIDVTVPLSALRIRKARSVRLIAQSAAGAYVDRVIALK